MKDKFGILIPLTSRGTNDIMINLKEFLLSFKRTQGNSKYIISFYFGIDNDDEICLSIDYKKLCNEYITCTVHVLKCNYCKGNICAIWRDLASLGYRDNCTFLVLMGDDCILKTTNWMDIIYKEFYEIQQERNLPFGFACVSLYDSSFPGFPSFPVIHRLHMEIFEGNIIPSVFINQDGDPFLFQIYRSFGASKLAKEAIITNEIGGSVNARYEKRHVEWTFDVIMDARLKAEAWLRSKGIMNKRLMELDVIVPTFRANLDYLERILSLKVPDNCTTQFTIIFDNPANDNIKNYLEAKHATNPFIRIRGNANNIGASESRNKGILESCAEWILFLDDDVIPDETILYAYCSKILEHPWASGFIGPTYLPIAKNSRQAAVVLAQLTYFWDIATKFPEETNLPWGVTANLCSRRTRVRFRCLFPKTGGGEDIDICIQTRIYCEMNNSLHEGFVAAPAAIAVHLWWNNGSPAYSRFFGWSYGDSHLIELYPNLCYCAFPNLAETILIVVLMFLCTLWSSYCFEYFKCSLVFILSSILSDFIYDAYNTYYIFNESPILLNSFFDKISSIIQSTVIRNCSELGRLCSHLLLGRISCICRRFNWFGSMWLGSIKVEYINSLKRFLFRVVFFFIILALKVGIVIHA